MTVPERAIATPNSVTKPEAIPDWPRPYSHLANVNCRIFVQVIPDAPCSRDSLDGSYGVYRIPSDRPAAADFSTASQLRKHSWEL